MFFAYRWFILELVSYKTIRQTPLVAQKSPLLYERSDDLESDSNSCWAPPLPLSSPPHSLPMCAPRSLAKAAVTLPVDRAKLGAAGGRFGDGINLLYFTILNEMKTKVLSIT